MMPRLVEILRCPHCGGRVGLLGEFNDDVITTAEMQCKSCQLKIPVVDAVPRAVSSDNYANNFGLQWNRFRQTQLDSYSGLPISGERFFRSTGWSPEELAGKRVLDVGCGAGRFAEIALRCGAEVVAIDYSSAVDACRNNLADHSRLNVVQADIYQLPFEPGSFDYVYSLGVLQHTPDVERAFASLASQLKPGGKLTVDVYPKLRRNFLWSKYWLRPFTRRIAPERLFRLVQRAVPPLLSVSRVVGRIPFVGKHLRYAIPVVNYEGIYPLSDKQLKEWAVLDTFDMFSPAYDQPQSAKTLSSWAKKFALKDCEVFRSGFLILRAVR